ncbi:MAG: alkene reductase [Luteitalea sp.]|nr:alkene reductase [Luteitalea sp.]
MELFTSYQLGDLAVANRMMMSAMTRNRAVAGNVPTPLAATYYSQRATAGVIVTEASQVSPQGVGYVRTPGIHSAEQVAGWRMVTDAVHRAGGVMFLQLWHVGRISHPDFHGGELPVAPSAIAPEGQSYTYAGPKPMVAPRALDLAELPHIVDQFRCGAEQAKLAGFDGVEIHGANGYLPDQFLRDGANQRTDAYGGSIPNRARLPLEIVEAVASVWDAGRVGYKISPTSAFNSMSDSNPLATFSYLVKELSARGVAYLAVNETIGGQWAVPAHQRITPALRALFRGTLIVNGGYEDTSGQAAIRAGGADLVAYGVRFLANPDLPRRFKEQAPLNAPDPATFYGGEGAGYVDYPFLDPIAAEPV